jgi:large repetitive protein
MRGHPAGVRAAVVSAIALTGLVLVGPALAASIASFSPANGLVQLEPGCEGTPVIIAGTGFALDGPTSSVSVSFNGAPATFVQVGSDRTIYTKVPAGATSGPITVTTAAGTATSTASFEADPCPYSTPGLPVSTSAGVASISAILPSSGKVGAKVTITGSRFAAVKKVQFGGVAASFKVVSPSKIIATVPKKAKSAKISVTTAAGTVKSSVTFRIK